MTNILDGKKLSENIRSEIAADVKKIVAEGKIPPGLSVIIVGNDKASHAYVASKRKACEAAGFYSREIVLSAETDQATLLQTIEQLNKDETIHGILLQLPLPKHLNEHKALQTIDYRKDVDGFHPINVGNLYIGLDTFVPCTPMGIMEILKRNNISIEGKNALVIGRSNIVGKPVAALLTKANATVTIAHSRTHDLPALVAQADVVVAGIGKPEFIKGSWIKEGAIVIDVGTNYIDDPTSPRGYRLIGDIEFAVAKNRTSFITPVPGGVGPMTIAMLLANTLKSRKNSG